ncbi:MAG: hypothetical protein HND47_21985 [Chloroflexi bacterium]|nr:hypothetical protein [Chloroflexota bacterium]
MQERGALFGVICGGDFAEVEIEIQFLQGVDDAVALGFQGRDFVRGIRVHAARAPGERHIQVDADSHQHRQDEKDRT